MRLRDRLIDQQQTVRQLQSALVQAADARQQVQQTFRQHERQLTQELEDHKRRRQQAENLSQEWQKKSELLERSSQHFRRQVEILQASVAGQLVHRFWAWKHRFLPEGTWWERVFHRLARVFAKSVLKLQPVQPPAEPELELSQDVATPLEQRRHSEGGVAPEQARLLLGNLDTPTQEAVRLGETNIFSGWALLTDGTSVSDVRIAYGDQVIGVCEYGHRRDDVYETHPNLAYAGSRFSGFSGVVYVPQKTSAPLHIQLLDSIGRKHDAFQLDLAPALAREERSNNIPTPPTLITTRGKGEIAAKISVVIPTKNAASEDFDRTLRSITQQKGIKELEILVVDSGSTDKTVDIAKKYGARVFTIPPEEFDHGETRNYGADQCTGELLVFTVHDAIPAGDDLYYNMARVLLADPKLAALSPRQVPRSDADLLACWQIWTHYRYVGFDTRLCDVQDANTFDSMPPREVRRLAGLDDVCSMHRRAIWETLRYRSMDFAEDLDFGIRSIKKGYKIGFLGNQAVIHSHTRPASYHLSKYYTDKTTLVTIFGEREGSINKWQDLGIHSVDQLFACASDLYAAIVNFVHTHPIEPGVPHKCVDLANRLLAYVSDQQATLDGKDPDRAGDDSLDRFFSRLSGVFVSPAPPGANPCTQAFQGVIHDLLFFLQARYPVLTGGDFLNLTYKVYAMVAGTEFGDYYGAVAQKGTPPENLLKLNTFLRRGILR